jgi:hypothetical protein
MFLARERPAQPHACLSAEELSIFRHQSLQHLITFVQVHVADHFFLEVNGV